MEGSCLQLLGVEATPIRRYADTSLSRALTRGLTRDTVAEWECHLQVSP